MENTILLQFVLSGFAVLLTQQAWVGLGAFLRGLDRELDRPWFPQRKRNDYRPHPRWRIISKR